MFKKLSVVLLLAMFAVATPAFCTTTKNTEIKIEAKSLMTRAKDVVLESKNTAMAAPAVVMALVGKYQWQAAVVASLATFALLYNYQDELASKMRAMFGCDQENECTSFCAKRK